MFIVLSEVVVERASSFIFSSVGIERWQKNKCA